MKQINHKRRESKSIQNGRGSSLVTTLIVASLVVATTSTTAVAQDLVILHTNDTHSQIEPITSGDNAGRGGVERREKYINSVRNENPNVILLDAGDFSQGTPYFSLYKGDVEIEIMNALGVDAACWGNHEFDNGTEELARRAREANFPLLCANYDLTGTPLQGVVKPYTIIERGGKKIGVIGVSVRLNGLVAPSTLEGMKYLHPYKIVTDLALKLRREGCDIVIVLSHCGFDGGSEQSPDDQMIAANTEGVDFIIGGHSHTFLDEAQVVKNKAGRDVTIVQAGEKGALVGRLDIYY